MLNKHKLLALGFFIGIGLNAMPSAYAFPALPSETPAAAGSNSATIELAQSNQGQYRRGQLNRRWDRRFHGDRCRYRAGGCRYYRDGYYYRTPWWTLPLVGAGVVIGSTLDDGPYIGPRPRRHVAWCLDRYRSYNPRSNTWVSNSGDLRQCNSPYN
jgi:BA14K-like protein